MAENWLMIGSGEKTAEYQAAGWTCLDGDPNSGADIIARVPYGYTPESLLELVKDCGFSNASGGGTHVAERDIRVEALR